MTFRSERYPTNWPAIRASIRARAVGMLPGLDGGDRG